MSDDLRVSWDAVNWNGEQGTYEILRSVDGSSYSQVGSVSAGTTQYDDTGLLDGEQYSYKVRAVNSAGSSTSTASSATTSLPAPSGVSATVQSNDQIDVSWTDTIDNGNYRIQILRDNGTWSDPSGGSSTVGQNTTSANYGPNSDTAYGRQVGIDSSFQFRVRAETEHTSTSYATSGTVYTDPIPPHNPSVSRPDANTFEISWTTQTDIVDYTQIQYRRDDGSGYGGWQFLDNEFNGDSTFTWSPSNQSQSGDYPQEDSRYQFKIREVRRGTSRGARTSPYVYADYGNNGNVYFEDDFEDNDVSEWDTVNGSGWDVRSAGGPADLQISGADSGTYYFYGEGQGSDDGTYLEKNLGDLSNETDVHIRCAFATASLDDGAEDFGISWYDGSSWQSLEHKGWAYNKQGWYEVHTLVPESWLASNNKVRVGTTTSAGMYGGDHLAVDRVVVSDILHEYTKPSAPSNLSLDNSTEGEITASWTLNNSLTKPSDQVETFIGTSSPPSDGANRDNQLTSYTFGGLEDGEKYYIAVNYATNQYRRGALEREYDSFANQKNGLVKNAVTRLPAPTGLTTSNILPTSADLSWTNNTSDADNQRVYLEDVGTPTGMNFDGTDDEVDLGNVSDTLKLGTGDFTFAFRCQPASIGSRQTLLEIDRYSSGILIRPSENNFDVYIDGSSWKPTVGRTAGTEYTYILTRTNGTVELWQNGTSQGTQSLGGSIDFTVNNGLTHIGKSVHTGGQVYDGDIYDVRVYDRALSASERDTFRNGGIVSNGLIGYWPLDTINTGTTPDLSEFANDGTVNGPTLTGAGLTDDSGALTGGTTSYGLNALDTNNEYAVYLQSETEHNSVRATTTASVDTPHPIVIDGSYVQDITIDGTSVSVVSIDGTNL